MNSKYYQSISLVILLSFNTLFGGLAYAQPLENRFGSKAVDIPERFDNARRHLGPMSLPAGSRAAGVNVIWEEDFSNGIPGTWANTGSVSNIWEYRGVSTSPDTSIGTRGAYGGNVRIMSPTWSNGWVIFDSDYLDNGGTGQIGTGSVPAPHFGALISESIDLSGQTEVILEFYQYIRYLQAATYVVFSSDGGSTWPDSVRINNSFPISANIGSAVDDYIQIDASPFIGGSSQAKMKFLFAPSSSGALCYYNWQIDDIRIVEKPNNDLAILPWDTDTSGNLIRSAITTGNRILDYGYITKTQLDPLTFQAIVENQGQLDQPNTNVQFDVTGPNGYIQNGTAAMIQTGEIVLFDNISNPFIPTGFGQYTLTMTVSSDSTDRDPDGWRPSNNEHSTDFTLSDTVMGIARQHGRTSLGTSSFISATDGIRLANVIELTQGDTLTSVTIGLTANTQPGGVVEITVRDTLPGFNGNFLSDFSNVLLRSDFYSITATDVNNGFATIPIPEVLHGVLQNRGLSADWYLVSAELFSSGGSFHVRIPDDLSVIQPWFGSIVYLPTDLRWFDNGNALHIWANFGKSASTAPDTVQVTACDSFVSPSGKVYTQSGIYLDTVSSGSGDSLKITYYADSSHMNCRPLGANKIYMHSGLGTSDSAAIWEYGIGNWGQDDGVGQMTSVGTNIWSTTIHVRDYYSQAVNGPVPPNDTLYNIGMVFRNEDASMEGMDDNNCQDIHVRGVNTSNPWVENYVGAPFSGVKAEWVGGSQDSIVVYDLTIHYNSYDTINPSACGSYTAPDGTLYTQGGTYTSIISNSAGCDSIITINLSLTPGDYDTIAPVACDTYTAPDGAVYTSSGTYTSILQNQAGCDSVITIHLTINRYSTNTISPVACGEYQAPDGSVFSSSGTYNITLTNSLGCDSLLTIQLTIENVDTTVAQNGPILTSNQAGAQYQWFMCDTLGGFTAIGGANNQSYTATANGWYAVVISTSNCSDTSDCVNVTSIGKNPLAGDQEYWKVQPNPTDGKFRVGGVLHSPDKVTMEIRAVTGALVETKTIEATDGKHSEAFDISNQPSGLYVLIIRSGNKQWQYRLVVE